MEIKQIICPVEDAIQLKKLGIKQESIFYYVNGWKDPRGITLYNGEHIISAQEMHITKVKAKERNASIEFISAFTVGELGILLPNYKASFRDGENGWYIHDSIPYCKTESEIRSKYLIYIIKNKNYSIDKINLRFGSDEIINDNF